MSRGLGSEQKAGRELFPSRGPSQTKTARRLPFPDFCAPNFFGCGWGCCIFSPQRTQRAQRREGRGMKWERAVVWGSVAVRANGSLTLAALRLFLVIGIGVLGVGTWGFGATAQAETCATGGRVERSSTRSGEDFVALRPRLRSYRGHPWNYRGQLRGYWGRRRFNMNGMGSNMNGMRSNIMSTREIPSCIM
jgi:hypothetical protein